MSGSWEHNNRRASCLINLEAEFQNEQKPLRQKWEIAESLGIEKSVARVWFDNKREKEKRKRSAAYSISSRSSESLNTLTISSPTCNYAGACSQCHYEPVTHTLSTELAKEPKCCMLLHVTTFIRIEIRL